MKRLSLSVLLAAVALISNAHSQNAKGLDVQIVKYEGLKDLVLKNRSKVVLVDIWFTL